MFVRSLEVHNMEGIEEFCSGKKSWLPQLHVKCRWAVDTPVNLSLGFLSNPLKISVLN